MSQILIPVCPNCKGKHIGPARSYPHLAINVCYAAALILGLLGLRVSSVAPSIASFAVLILAMFAGFLGADTKRRADEYDRIHHKCKDCGFEYQSHRVVTELLAVPPEDDFIRAKLYGSDMRGRDLSHKQLFRAEMSTANLEGANLSHANLKGAVLRRARLRRANLHGADLRGADFYAADLRDADLSEAQWEAKYRGYSHYTSELHHSFGVPAGEYLGELALSRPQLVRAEFRDALYNGKTKWPEGLHPEEVRAILED